MSTHAYPAQAIAGDYVRAVAGLCLVGLPLATAETAAVVTAVLAASAVVFILYGAKTVNRHFARIELSEDGIRSRGLSATEIRWRDLQRLQLSHYSTRRDRTGGWLQLLLVGDAQRLTIDSQLQDFLALAARAVVAAREKQIRLDPATVSNLCALGLSSMMEEPSARKPRG
jgi:hypothetical protein